jgi:hypothetical protein
MRVHVLTRSHTAKSPGVERQRGQNPQMFDFGISGYRPRWRVGLSAVRTDHGDRLRALCGRRLTNQVVGYHGRFVVRGLFDFDGNQVEVNHQKFSELSITWNTVNPAVSVRWPTGDQFQLAWRNDAVPELSALHGRQLQIVNILEWTGSDLAHGTIAVSFVFAEGQVTISNGLDENHLAFNQPLAAYRSHPLA